MVNNKNSESFLSYYWKKFKRSKLALFGLGVNTIFILVAILGYSITPDSTPLCNTQYIELTKQPPGFKVQMIKLRKNEASHKVGFLTKLFIGERSDYRYLPISSYRFEDDQIYYREFQGKRKRRVTAERKLKITDIVFPLKEGDQPIYMDGEIVQYQLYDKDTVYSKSIQRIRSEIESNHIYYQKFVLGTDTSGRDMLSRLMIGARISLSVGIISVIISLLIGVTLGTIAGYSSGYIDDAIVWFINVVWSIPSILLVVAISAGLGTGLLQIYIAIGLTMWVEVARVIRGKVKLMRSKSFVEAGRALGFSKGRIIFRHILPNVMGPILVISIANFATAIIIESGLSFLNIGVQAPIPSWGAMISDHRNYIISDKAYLALVPGCTIVILVMSYVLIGKGLKRMFDARTGEEDISSVA